MKKMEFEIKINAPAKKVWQVLWNDATYRKWTSVFSEGSHAVSDWKEGSKIQFLDTKGSGMYSVIESLKPNEYMAFKHLGEVKDFKEQPDTKETNSWKGAMETYLMKEEDGITTLYLKSDSNEEFEGYFKDTFPKALALIKTLAERPIEITVETPVKAPVEKVWKLFTAPEHITKWNNASEDWHTPAAQNDLKVNGRFVYRMEAKDGSFGFDFGGVYNEVKPNEAIAYTMDDGRKAKISFINSGKETKVVETFEAEAENSLDLQQGGWQSILNNFKNYVESNS